MSTAILKTEIDSLVMENQALHAEMLANETQVAELQRQLRIAEQELATLHAEAAKRVLERHIPSGPDLQALEAAADNIPLTPHQLSRLKTLAREFLFLCL
ncbi:MAG: hypothetical protein EBY32_12865 [Proteobacteria bacterium]|nr:hypothetical protein [Pseudomonadota bacterium]